MMVNFTVLLVSDTVILMYFHFFGRAVSGVSYTNRLVSEVRSCVVLQERVSKASNRLDTSSSSFRAYFQLFRHLGI